MKTLFNTNYHHKSLDFALLLLRVCIAAFMLYHGIPKMNGLLAGDMKFADPIGIGAPASLILAVFAEVLCSVLIALGLATRLAVIALIINMAVAVFVVHAADGFEKQESGSHYLLVYVFLLFSGAGKYSIDYFISRSNGRSRRKY